MEHLRVVRHDLDQHKECIAKLECVRGSMGYIAYKNKEVYTINLYGRSKVYRNYVK